MRVKMLNVEKKDNRKVVNYIEAIRSQGKDITAMHLYVSDEDLVKWQEEANAVGWPLQLWILSVVNGYLKQIGVGIPGDDGEKFLPEDFKSHIESRFMKGE